MANNAKRVSKKKNEIKERRQKRKKDTQINEAMKIKLKERCKI